MPLNPALVPLGPSNAELLGDLLEALVAAGDGVAFHPHPLSRAHARWLASCASQDIYVLVLVGDRAVAYGMLRGWDEGHAVPSLGIAVHPEERGCGWSRLLMRHLHALAEFRSAPRVRLRVHAENLVARRLYDSLGYEWSHEEGDSIVGYWTPSSAGRGAASGPSDP